ncbi:MULTISPECIES: O-methyltransferase [Persicobacter]|uniref:O-methyltransferase n=1 Tax=Persicobacter diffluens TaxID=981 RepID=A0AAN4VWA2_9BACT|nr:O-methyltransferase [Persicobacter sp. CCB-QB2]GJM60122.1 O-methyltransferase [Persicobacter diffluens]
MEFIDPELQAYCDAHTDKEPEVLTALDRDTNVNVLMPRMLSGHFQGRFLSIFTHILKPKRILEIGTFTGYSGIAMAEGLPEDGELVTVDINEELTDMVEEYAEQAGVLDKIKILSGPALEIIPALEGTFDLVFIDADKGNYANYYELIVEKLNPGGVILADNVLWSGKVLEKNRKKLDKDTAAVLDFNRKVQEDPRVENILLPLRDGLMMARKK